MLLAQPLYFMGPNTAATHLPLYSAAGSNVTLVH